MTWVCGKDGYTCLRCKGETVVRTGSKKSMDDIKVLCKSEGFKDVESVAWCRSGHFIFKGDNAKEVHVRMIDFPGFSEQLVKACVEAGAIVASRKPDGTWERTPDERV